MRAQAERIRVGGLVLTVAVSAAATDAAGQTVYLCADGGRSFAVLGHEGAPGCQALTDPERDLHLSGAQPDLDDVMRQLAAQSARIDRLEQLLLGRRPSLAPRARPPAQADPFDTRGRLRDLGQDLDRRLDELSP